MAPVITGNWRRSKCDWLIDWLTRNRSQKNVVELWRRFLKRVPWVLDTSPCYRVIEETCHVAGDVLPSIVRRDLYSMTWRDAYTSHWTQYFVIVEWSIDLLHNNSRQQWRLICLSICLPVCLPLFCSGFLFLSVSVCLSLCIVLRRKLNSTNNLCTGVTQVSAVCEQKQRSADLRCLIEIAGMGNRQLYVCIDRRD